MFDFKTPCTLIAPVHLHPYIRQELLLQNKGILGVTLLSLNSYLKQELMEDRFEQEPILFEYFHLMQQHRSQLHIFKDAVLSYTFLSQCYQVIEDLKKYHIEVASLKEDTNSNKELKQILSLLYPIHTPSDQMNRCLEGIFATSQEHVYILDTNYSYYQNQLVEKLYTLGAHKITFPTLCESKVLYYAVNKKQECEALAQHILKNDLDAEDIAVTLCDKEYGVLLEQVFEHYQIPYCSFAKSSCSGTIYVTFIALLQYYLEPNLEHLLNVLSRNVFQHKYIKEFIDYLRIFEADIHQSFSHIRNRNQNGNVVNQIDLERFETLEEKAEEARKDLIPALWKLHTCNDISKLLTYLLEIVHTSMQNDTSNLSIYKDVCEVFSKCVDVMQDKDDLAFLLMLLKEKEVQKESKVIQGACITSLSQSQLPRKYHFVLGATSKNYPGFAPKNGIFDEQYFEGLAYPSMQERYLLHTKQTMDQLLIHRHLIVFSPLGTYDGHSLEVALELENICEKLGNYPIQHVHIPKATHITQISQDDARALFVKDDCITGSISALERFSKCPYAYFLRYGLKIKDPIQLGFANNYMGTLAHYIMESLLHEGSKEAFLQLDPDTLQQIIDSEMKIVEDVFPNKKEYLQFLAKRIYHAMWQCIKRFQKQEATSAFTPWQVEHNFEYPIAFDEATLKLIGIIDRIDITSSYAMVFDYKSSPKTMSLDDFKCGLSLQLPVYSTIVKEHFHKEVAGTYYFSMKNENVALPYASIKRRGDIGLHVLDDEQKQELLRKQHMHGGMAYSQEVKTYDPEGSYLKNVSKYNNLNEIIDQTKAILQKIVSNILSGNIAIAPTKDACTFCKMKEICRHHGGYRESEPLIGNEGNKEVEA